MKKKNSAHQLVIDSLTEALLQLMEHKKLNEITISELCEKAGVSRISFYRNFDYVSDIITGYLYADLERWWIDNDSSVNLKKAPQDFWKKLFSHFKKNERVIKLLYTSNESIILKNIIFKACGPTSTCEEPEAYARAMLAGTIFGYTDEWIKRGMKDYPDYLSLKDLVFFLDNSINTPVKDH